MTFASELWLFALVVPAIGLLASLLHRKRSLRSQPLSKAKRVEAGFGHVHLTPDRRTQRSKWIFHIGLALVIVALARPRWGSFETETFQRSREVVIAMDLSKSMLATDIKPNRLERSKLVVESLLGNLQGESVGLIVFAGTAFLQSPMSPDYQILRGFLKDLDPDFVPQGGTNYGAMLETALDSFRQSDSEADRFLIVISDGESLDDSWREYLPELKKQNVRVLALGFGTEGGALIPDGEGSYLKDSDGAVVLTRLQADTLQELARRTGGVYREANVWVDLAQLIEETVKSGRAGETGKVSQIIHIERYQLFLGAGLALILLSLFREFPTVPKPRTLKPERTAS